MPLVSDDAFVLDVHPYGERDVVAVLFTRVHGLKRTAAKGARARMSRFSGALQTLNEVQATWFDREGRELASLREARPVKEIFPAVGTDPAAGAVVAWIADHLRTFVPEHEENATFWRLAGHLRDALLAGVPPLLVARYAEVWALRLAGIFPPLGACGICSGPIDPEPGDGDVARDAVGHFLCNGCARGGARFVEGRGAGAQSAGGPADHRAQTSGGGAGELRRGGGALPRSPAGISGKELVSHGVVERMLAE